MSRPVRIVYAYVTVREYTVLLCSHATQANSASYLQLDGKRVPAKKQLTVLFGREGSRRPCIAESVHTIHLMNSMATSPMLANAVWHHRLSLTFLTHGAGKRESSIDATIHLLVTNSPTCWRIF